MVEKKIYAECVKNSNLYFSTIEDNINKSFIYNFIKRTIDIVGSLLGIVILSPIFLIVALAIKIEDPKGSIIFGHKRVGLNGKQFKCWKFRSMVHNAEEVLKTLSPEQKKEYSETFKLKNDPRITKVGNFIRKTSLDELPQLFNILKGEMSIVGPRPIVTKELDFYGEYAGYFMSIKPGLTGLWQVSGRSDTTYDERVELDMEYIIRRNTLLDIYIIFMTAIKVVKREGAR
ncbi:MULTISPECIES: sugar transferase [unclassified Romboutsia]|uniref:sugar transferase n=1 Tax=unclassified Romboutsia TaxID=2626894 RepID=UPI000820D437|nr:MULTISPECIES: sugar transferase [unclassified Romboutsia]SCI44278.1 Putative colanic biosynthesis UDP-glucose lipid carrier transferase [uncultured Clostridium sp.]